jgi:putative transposase
LDELLAGYEKPEDLTGPDGLLKQLTGTLVERALGTELTEHLATNRGSGRHWYRQLAQRDEPKMLLTEQGKIPIEVPRDRVGTFEPKLVKKHQRRFDGFDEKILSMYRAGGSRSTCPSCTGPRCRRR